MKEKEEDEERNDNICPQTNNQVNKQRIQTLRSTLILCGSSGERANFVLTIFFLNGTIALGSYALCAAYICLYVLDKYI